MTSIDENRIRNLAYQIWESEGRPDGREGRHWEMAQTLAQAEDEAGAVPDIPESNKPAPRSASRAKRVVDKPDKVKKPGSSRTRSE